jgi:hypothetical protein
VLQHSVVSIVKPGQAPDALADGTRRIRRVKLRERLHILQRLVIHSAQHMKTHWCSASAAHYALCVRGVLVAVLEQVLDLGDEQATSVIELCAGAMSGSVGWVSGGCTSSEFEGRRVLLLGLGRCRNLVAMEEKRRGDNGVTRRHTF